MKQIVKVLVLAHAIISVCSNVDAQVYSAQVSFSPSSSALIDDATRFEYHYGNWSYFYMRYNDSAYLCCEMIGALWLPNPGYFVLPLDQSFVIKDFKKLSFMQGFVGSYGGQGMCSRIPTYPMSSSGSYPLTLFLLPAVDQLDRVAIAKLPYSYNNPVARTRAFSIGQKAISGTSVSQSYLVEYYEDSYGASYYTYRYIPLPFINENEREIADDVITFEDKVVFATRDTRMGYNPVNLRITDTSSALMGGGINIQWRIPLSAGDILSSRIRLQYIGKDYFMVVYCVYNANDNQYYICYHRIFMHDLLSGINSIVSHIIPIDKEFCDLQDVVYEPDVNTMVILTNGFLRSELYHVDPFSQTNDYAYKIEYNDKCLYSLDTVGDSYGSPNADSYVAMGGGRLFYQDISGGYVIAHSCMPIVLNKAPLRVPPIVNRYVDAVNCYSNAKLNATISPTARATTGTQSCISQ